jgi:hypothetical protein
MRRTNSIQRNYWCRRHSLGQFYARLQCRHIFSRCNDAFGPGQTANLFFYNIDGSRIVTDSLGQIKTHFIKNSHGSVKVSGVNTKTCPSCPLLDNASFNYDGKGYPNSMLDANGNTSYLSCNERGLQISHTKAARTAEEQASTQVWHETLNLPVAIHEPGRSTYYSYDNDGNVLEKCRVDTATNVQGFELPAPIGNAKSDFRGFGGRGRRHLNNRAERTSYWDYEAQG